MRLIHPKHTFASVVKLLAQGLRDGSIVLDPDKEPDRAMPSPSENFDTQLHNLVRIVDELSKKDGQPARRRTKS